MFTKLNILPCLLPLEKKKKKKEKKRKKKKVVMGGADSFLVLVKLAILQLNHVDCQQLFYRTTFLLQATKSNII